MGVLPEMPKSTGLAVQKAKTLIDVDPKGKLTTELASIAATVSEQAGEAPQGAAPPKEERKKRRLLGGRKE